ncbi:BgTH12-06207 [Blumeria graminis f. sp. triticale]|uniref:BgTH12-06207 n=1 Tax=Blumeria graminis f. sp. triticale TaxID=1689686 RepID=A0A9W4D5E0_BLUGR|nr:BgTH12-06207 [Blumeria graminis f. sp. triticale]
MYCFYFFIKLVKIIDNRFIYNYNFVSNLDLSPLQFTGHATPYTLDRNTLITRYKSIKFSNLPSFMYGTSWGKYCSSSSMELDNLYNYFSAKVVDIQIKLQNIDLDDSQPYQYCVDELQTVYLTEPHISISKVRAGYWPSCSVRFLLKYIATEKKSEIMISTDGRRQRIRKPTFIMDSAVTVEELLDSPYSALSLKSDYRESHLVYVFGSLRIIQRLNPNDDYELSSTLAEESISQVYEIFKYADEKIQDANSLALHDIKIRIL